MSVQLVVCSPKHYLTEWTILKNPKPTLQHFENWLEENGLLPSSDVAAGATATESRLKVVLQRLRRRTDREHYSADLLAGPTLTMSSICYSESADMLGVLGNSFYTPFSQQPTLSLSYESPPTEMGEPFRIDVGSVLGLSQCLTIVGRALSTWGDTKERERVRYCLECYKDAVRISMAVGQPIFVSV